MSRVSWCTVTREKLHLSSPVYSIRRRHTHIAQLYTGKPEHFLDVKNVSLFPYTHISERVYIGGSVYETSVCLLSEHGQSRFCAPYVTTTQVQGLYKRNISILYIYGRRAYFAIPGQMILNDLKRKSRLARQTGSIQQHLDINTYRLNGPLNPRGPLYI